MGAHRHWLERIDRSDPEGCWLWTGSVQSAGYGMVSINTQRHLVHRLAYETFVGPIPDGLTIDHLCCVRRCVNPAHLEPVTRAENARRGEKNRRTRRGGQTMAARTHCKHGHELTGENVRMRGNTRVCRACARRRIEEFNQRAKAVA